MYFNLQKSNEENDKKNSNNVESLTLQVDGPITRRAYVWRDLRGAYNWDFTVC